jgi:hypothetical protein
MYSDVPIAAEAIVASTSGLIFQQELTYPWQENHRKDLHPFSIAVLLSVACTLGFWFLYMFCDSQIPQKPKWVGQHLRKIKQ